MTDDQLRRIIVLVPAYSDDDNNAYHIRIARAVLAAAHKIEVCRLRDARAVLLLDPLPTSSTPTTKGKL
jgi:hypothetical protein